MVLTDFHANQSETIQKELASLGNSFLFVSHGETAKIHIHTNDPERIVQISSGYGTLISEKIEDMTTQLPSKANIPEEAPLEITYVFCQEEESIPLLESLGAVVLATKNGFCKEAPKMETCLQKPFSFYSSLTEEETISLLGKYTANAKTITYRDDDLSLAELFL